MNRFNNSGENGLSSVFDSVINNLTDFKIHSLNTK